MLQNLEQDDPKKRKKYVSVCNSDPVLHESQTPKQIIYFASKLKTRVKQDVTEEVEEILRMLDLEK